MGSIAPIPKVEDVRTSCRRSSERANSRLLGAEDPAPNRLSRKVAPSGLEPVVPPISSRIVELAGTTSSISYDVKVKCVEGIQAKPRTPENFPPSRSSFSTSVAPTASWSARSLNFPELRLTKRLETNSETSQLHFFPEYCAVHRSRLIRQIGVDSRIQGEGTVKEVRRILTIAR